MEALAIAAALVMAGEQSLLHIPGAEEVRFQKIERTGNETQWPFSVDKGLLACVWGTGQRLTYFYEDPQRAEAEGRPPRFLVLSVNPFDLAVLNIAHRGLFAESGSLEQRMKLVAPFIATAQRLCDQPPGTHVGTGEL
ncbi:MAG: hypothetical protein J0H34_06570 [Rhizobiales bacterium]|nr:hypothetical protein [Hyphomicrobiales bacterium]